MNSFFKSVLLWAAVICAVPAAAAAAGFRTESPAGLQAPNELEAPGELQASHALILSKEDRLRLLCSSTGEITELSAEEYAVFAVLEEVPFIPDGEALKAQVCAARTYAARRILTGEAENGAHISDDGEKYQTVLTEAEARAVYGEDFDRAYSLVKSAADATYGEIIMYGGAPAAAVFHVSSAGATESAENVWGTAYPYLVSVPSDCSESLRDFSYAELGARISAEYGEAEEYGGIEILSCSEAGTVLSLRICGIEMSGARLAEILSLDSAAFDISDIGGRVRFTVRGSGHLAGMSICGADEMSREGYSYREILEHYYPGTSIGKIG
ncbi:MAG: SpoIID/LytB domain-containing protein [Oscillospiraceae bacterium]|nr:SpoIID/LytB domain-containing protein [Oscillospiraceae bacterium]